MSAISFGLALQSAEVQALLQSNALYRVFFDALFPATLFRSVDAEPELWPGGIGQTLVFTGKGLIKPDGRPITPGEDLSVAAAPKEQWTATASQYGKATETFMPGSIAAIVNLFHENTQDIGLQAAQTLNRLPRNVEYNAAMSGWTVASGAQSAVTSLRVARLNGFTKARRPDLSAGSAVLFDAVSSNNPLKITVNDSGSGAVERLVTGFVPDNDGDEIGPGLLTINSAVTVVDRAYIIAYDRTSTVRVGAGNRDDDVGSTDTVLMADVRSALSRLRNMNVPKYSDRRYHAHLDPVSQAQLFGDPEFQRLNQGLPDYYPWRDFAIGQVLGTIFFENSECPQVHTVEGGLTAEYSLSDRFGGELYNNGATSGVELHRILISGQGGLREYYMDQDGLITEAGLTGKVGTFDIQNNGLTILTERIRMVFRAPIDRALQNVSSGWTFIGDWAERTDSTTGDAARYKRVIQVVHGA